ncbi:SusC/RagA family TonB-linked outer membrane protein [Parabacteroides goldsteinii]|uniref:SusC/RagA family TonB-linked outer membrane protein n=1 Tax=Parabacteroides goldsteinii TaxID=328812 RepID=UPI003AF0ABD4
MEIKPVQIQSLSFSIPQRIVKGVQVACLLSFVLPAFAAADSNDLLTVRESKYVEMQQTQKVSGSVSDDFGPLVGVSIHVKGTTNGTVTDMDGNFSLEAKPGDILVISYVGYLTIEHKVTAGPVNLSMKEDTQKLDEVIVLGYGTTTKRSMIAAVSTVNAEEMAALPVTNITQGLAGRSPGLIVQGSGGGINKTSTVSIRGGGTPLVVIDGVIRDYGDFVALAPENIANLSILKDASATAVYGSRASNGILQVTTKQGKEGKPQIDYNFNQSWSQPNVWPDKLNSYERAIHRNVAAANDGVTIPYNDDDLRMFADGSDPYGHPNTDWQKEVMKNFAPQQKHNITISGGGASNTYYASIGHINQQSLYKSDSHYMKRTNFQLTQTSTFKSIGLKTTTQLDGYMQFKTHPYTSTSSGYGNVFSHVQNKSPMEIGRNKYGLVYNNTDNPIAEISDDGGYIDEKENVVNGLLGVEWDLPWVKGLKLRAKGSYRYYIKDNKSWRKDAAQYAWDSQEPTYASKPQLSQYGELGNSWTLQYFAEYNRTFGKHSVSALGGYEYTSGFGHSMGLVRKNYDFPIDQINPGPSSTMENSGGEWENGRAGWVGQVKYNYDNRYFVEASMRYDGSDNFPKDHRWGTFYSGSIGWSLADEAFMETIREKHIFDMLKIRASYGQVGLDNWGNDGDTYHIGRFAYLTSYGLGGQEYVMNGEYVPGFWEGSLPSPDLTWFTTDQFDAGFDFSSLNNRLYGSFDYFYYATKGFLYAPDALDVGYTDPLGVSLPKISTDGEHRRAGVEFQLGWRDDIGDFHYDVAFNFTKFDELWANNPSESLENKKNPYKRTTQQRGYAGVYYENMGFYKDANDVYNSVQRTGSHSLTAGDLKYYDFNGDGVIDGADQHRLGKSSFPRANYGLNINLSYKGFSFSTLFQGATRFDMYLGSVLMMSDANTGSSPTYEFQTDYWTPENTDAKFPRLLSSTGNNGSNNTVGSDFWLINGGYLRMRDIQVGYDFKRILLKKSPWITRLNVALSGQNIFTISEATKYGIDPENGSANRYDYPNERVFAINFGIGF